MGLAVPPLCSYSASLNRRCTHLLVGENVLRGEKESQKLGHARRIAAKWNLRVVTMDWWQCCIDRGAQVDEAEFAVPPPAILSELQRKVHRPRDSCAPSVLRSEHETSPFHSSELAPCGNQPLGPPNYLSPGHVLFH